MVCGYPPFYSDNSKETCKKILSWKKFLKYPTTVKLSDDVKDLMNGLINDVDKRLGYHGASEIKKHPWFKDLNWDNLKSMKAPFVPKIAFDWDTKYFECLKEKPDKPFYNVELKNKKNVESVSNYK